MERYQLLKVVDYYYRYNDSIEISKLSSTTSSCDTTHQINLSKTWHTRNFCLGHGPQFSSTAFTQFAMDYGFHHQTSIPNYPQSNGEAKRAVQTVISM